MVSKHNCGLHAGSTLVLTVPSCFLHNNPLGLIKPKGVVLLAGNCPELSLVRFFVYFLAAAA